MRSGNHRGCFSILNALIQSDFFTTQERNGMDRVAIKELDMGLVKHDTTLYIYGRRRSGKSVLVKDILFNLRKIPRGVLFSETEASTPTPCFSECIPSSFIHEEYNPGIVDKIMDSQAEKMKKGSSTIDSAAFVIFDDMMASSALWKRDRTLRKILMNGRHYGILFACTSQHVLGVDPALRTNFDWIFIAKDQNLSNRKKLYDHFASIIPTFALFQSLMDRCTEDHRFLVLQTCGVSNKWEDNVFYYKAKIHPPFRVGSQRFWNFHESLQSSVDRNDGVLLDLPK
jgi:hypothetical protein